MLVERVRENAGPMDLMVLWEAQILHLRVAGAGEASGELGRGAGALRHRAVMSWPKHQREDSRTRKRDEWSGSPQVLS